MELCTLVLNNNSAQESHSFPVCNQQRSEDTALLLGLLTLFAHPFGDGMVLIGWQLSLSAYASFS